jgi:hypothetical protein
MAKAARRSDAQTQNQTGCGQRSGDEQQQDPLSRLANVAVLTRESPSEARVSSAFNTELASLSSRVVTTTRRGIRGD